MKLKNELIFICLILFILISVSAVSAEENTTSIISINNTDDYVLKVTFDSNYSDEAYSNLIDYINIEIKSYQKV